MINIIGMNKYRRKTYETMLSSDMGSLAAKMFVNLPETKSKVVSVKNSLSVSAFRVD